MELMGDCGWGTGITVASTFCTCLSILVAGISHFSQAQIPPPDFESFVNASCTAAGNDGIQYMASDPLNDNSIIYCCNFAATVTIDPKGQISCNISS
jgi:hypothetical protein